MVLRETGALLLRACASSHIGQRIEGGRSIFALMRMCDQRPA